MHATAAVDHFDALWTARHHPAALIQELAKELLLVLTTPPLGIAAAPDQVD
jgi:hypothetical protein